MAVTTTQTNKPLNPRGNDQSPLAYNRAKLFSGKALDFDGVNDSVGITDNNNLDFATNFSIVQYVLIDSLQKSKIFYSNYSSGKGAATGISDTTNNIVKFYTKGAGADNTLYSSFALNTNEWYQVIATYDGATKKIYINGQLDTSVSYTDSITYTNATPRIGALSGLSTQFFNGQLSNTKIFNTALTAAQVADLYNNPEKVVPTGVDNTALKLWLPMQEGAGTTAYDGSGNGNHGTISGATYTHGIGAPVAQTAVIDWNKGTNIFGNSDWDASEFAQDCSVSTSSHPAPNGTDTAFVYDDGTATSSTHRLYKNDVASAGAVTAYSFFKKKDVDYINIVLGVDGGGVKYFALIDLVDGTINDTDGSPTATSVKNVGNGWYFVSIEGVLSTPNAYTYIWGQNPANGSTIDINYTGSNNQTYIWGAGVHQGSINNVFVPTIGSRQPNPVLLPQGLTSGRDITGVNLFENVRKQGALNLDGNSWAEVHDNASLDVSEFTLEGWIYTNSITSDNRILSKWFSGYPNRTFQFSATNDDLYLYISDGSSSNNTFVLNVLSLNNWYHCVATYDGANLKIYLDGVLKATTASTMTLKDSDQPVYIGAYVGSLDPSDNTTAQPRIYNRALTAEEVQRNYNAGKNTYTN